MNYIDAKHLMIDDYVQRDGRGVGKVICTSAVSVLVLMQNGTIETWSHDIEPIPLTAEMLKKLGFKREGGADYWSNDTFNAVIIHWNTNINELVIGQRHKSGIVDINVIYVHEIQHAFRICGLKDVANKFKL